MNTTPGLTLSLSRPSFATEGRALWMAFWRETLIFLRYPSWFIALFIWPVLFPATYILSARALAGPDGSGLAHFIQTTGTQNFIGYIIIGTTIWMCQNTVLWDVGTKLREEQMRGTLEANWLSPTWRFSFLLGPSLINLLQNLFFVAITLLEFGLIFGIRFEGNLGLAFLGLLASFPAIYGLGFAFASLVITLKETNAFVFLMRGLVMVFCGVTFPIDVLPGWMQSIARWLPQTYAIRLIRNAALTDASLPTLLPDFQALFLFGIFWVAVGYTLFVWMERRARQTGAIGQY